MGRLGRRVRVLHDRLQDVRRRSPPVGPATMWTEIEPGLFREELYGWVKTEAEVQAWHREQPEGTLVIYVMQPKPAGGAVVIVRAAGGGDER